MPNEIIVALLGFAGTAVGSSVGAFASSRLTNYRLEQVEKKLDSMSNSTTRITILEERSNDHEKRIGKLEEKKD